MSSALQTVIALGVVAVALGWLLWTWFGKKKSSCGSSCGAVSPEINKLKRTVNRHAKADEA